MKKIITKLEKALEDLRELIKQRGIYVDGRSEKWQESEKFEAYEDRTAEIESNADELEDLISTIKEESYND